MASRKFHPSRYLPIWTTAHTNVANLVVVSLLQKFGVTDIPSYFRQLRIPIAISVVFCSWYGAPTNGITGFAIGAVLGLAGPAALLWLLVIGIATVLILAIYVLWWMALLWVLGWLLIR